MDGAVGRVTGSKDKHHNKTYSQTPYYGKGGGSQRKVAAKRVSDFGGPSMSVCYWNSLLISIETEQCYNFTCGGAAGILNSH